MAVDGLAKLAYEASLLSLEKQERVLDELRARTAVLLAASSLAASFLGGRALDDAQPLLLVAALGAFGLSIGGCIYVLVPRPSFTFSLAGSAVYEGLFEFRLELEEVYRRLAYDLDRFWEQNDTAMQPLFAWFKRSAVAFGLDVVLLLAAVSDTLV